MRYCPVCDERYDEEVIKFCTKDGTPLVDDGQPNFVILPSENAQAREMDAGEETVIRRKGESNPFDPSSEPERIVIPPPSGDGPRVRAREARVYHPPPPPPPQNIAKTVVLTILGTLVVLSFGAGLMWLFQKEPPANMNVNLNPINMNADLNSNLGGFNSNFNFNFNSNMNSAYPSNFNFNFNMNLKTPMNTPTPKQSPISSPTPLVASPSPTPKPPSPKPSQSPSPRPPAMMSNRPPGNRN